MNNYLITPESDIYLLKCPLEMDSLHQLDFTSATAQHNYFNSLPKILMDNATYMRKDGRLYFDDSFDTCLPYNYCMYRNDRYSNKWFYAFVSDLRFESNNSCSCQLTTDVFQTWQFEVTLHQSFVERFIPAKQYDTVGRYTYPEDMQLGDYISNDAQQIEELADQNIVLGVTVKPSDFTKTVNGIYQNIPSGCAYYTFALTNAGITDLNKVLGDLTDDARQDAVTSLFLAPQILCSSTAEGTYSRINNSYMASIITDTLSTQVQGLDGYVPHNNKLYTYPYYYILVSNGAGGTSILKNELWNPLADGKKWRTYATLTPGCSVIGLPMDYAGHDLAWEHALPLGKYPQLNYATDQFTNWQTQNGLNNSLQQGSGMMGILGGAALAAGGVAAILTGVGTGLGVGMIGTGVTTAFGGAKEAGDALKEKQLAEKVPPQYSSNSNSGDVWSSVEKITFRFNWMSIRSEYAREIDHYFDMYGYRVNKLMGVTNRTRNNWNYIKTIDVNITGDIPQEDMQKFKSLYNNGFTIWHNPSTFLDYSQTNA